MISERLYKCITQYAKELEVQLTLKLIIVVH